MSELHTDVTVVGGGIAGLWSAKELIDQGLVVDVVEKSDHLASGPTTRNEGWLHAGTYHAVAIYDEADARNVTERTMYGHDQIVAFAPEAIEHGPSYALLGSDEMSERLLPRWDELGVEYRNADPREFDGEGFDLNRVRRAFAVKDKSVHSRIICAKLVQHIRDGGGRIFTETDFHPVDENTADLVIDGEKITTHSDNFIIAAGAGTKAIFNEAGVDLPMRYYKSHLLVTPRLTRDNFFYLDPLEAGIMSHGNASIIGINREATEVQTAEYDVISQTESLVYQSLVRMLPRAAQYRLGSSEVRGVACVKVDITPTDLISADTNVVLQNLNVKVFEPTKGYICALPGKMTEAPYLAQVATNHVLGNNTCTMPMVEHSRANARPADTHPIRLRPADEWMNHNGAR